ncbi:MAG: sigma-70 family RNA polymerase sigma factor [Acidobacteriaceae bacterium]
MSMLAAPMEGVEQLGDGLPCNVLEMTQAITERLPYFRRIAMRRLDNAADAEDAVQDAFLAAWKHLGKFRGQAKMSTWLTTIVLNSSRMVIRKRGRLRSLPIDGHDGSGNRSQFSELLPDCRPDPEAHYRNSEYELRMQLLFARLPPALRVIAHMRGVNGLSVRETAEALGLTESAVKSRAARARAELQRLNRTTPCRPAWPPKPEARRAHGDKAVKGIEIRRTAR